MKRTRKPSDRPGTVRRSVALPRPLVERVVRAALEDGPGTFNGIVREALEEYVARRAQVEFEEEMARMAADPHVRAVNAEIDREFRATEGDGLPRC